MEQTRQNIRRIIFGITSVILVVLAARFFLEVSNATRDHFLTQLVFGLSDPILQMFQGMFAGAGVAQLVPLLEISVAAVFVIFMGIFIASLINSFIQEHPSWILHELIDTFFKLAEFILISRLVLKIFGVPRVTPIVDFVYSSTDWVSGLLPSINVLGGTLEFSTLFVIIAVVVVDFISEGFIESLQKEDREERKSGGGTTKVVHSSQPHNITINMPKSPQNPRQGKPQVININPPRHEQTLPRARKK